jgi:hypothetical protein
VVPLWRVAPLPFLLSLLPSVNPTREWVHHLAMEMGGWSETNIFALRRDID